MRRARFLVVIVSAALAVSTFTARAETPALAGFNISAVGVGAQFVYVQPSAPVPTNPTAEMHAGYSLSTFTAGPSAHSLASTLWPGSAAAGLGPALGLLLPVNPGVPAYPVRAETYFPQPPADVVNEVAPGTRMEASSSATSTRAASALAGADQPGIVSGGSYTSDATSGLVGQTAAATASARAAGVSLAGGLVTFDSVMSTATVVSDGRTATTQGVSQVTGLVIAGQAATIDGSGVHAGPSEQGTAAATELIRGTLRQAGLSLQLSQPADLLDGAKGSRSLGGLLVTFTASAIRSQLDALVPGFGAGLDTQVPFDQSLVIAFGAVHVSSAASLETSVPTIESPAGDALSGGGGAPFAVAGERATDGELLPAATLPGGAPTPLAAAPAGTVVDEFGGVGGALLLALLGAVALAPFLAAAPGRVVAAPASRVACRSEDPADG